MEKKFDLTASICAPRYQCPGCKKYVMVHEICEGVCEPCYQLGYWVDPVGGLHQDDFDDPAAMYE